MAVASHADFSRNPEACHKYRMADTVAWAGHIHAKLLGRRLQVDVIIRCHAVYVEKIVVQIAHADIYLGSRKAHRLKSEVSLLPLSLQDIVFFY